MIAEKILLILGFVILCSKYVWGRQIIFCPETAENLVAKQILVTTKKWTRLSWMDAVQSDVEECGCKKDGEQGLWTEQNGSLS
jgi:hypothetical protein